MGTFEDSDDSGENENCFHDRCGSDEMIHEDCTRRHSCMGRFARLRHSMCTSLFAYKPTHSHKHKYKQDIRSAHDHHPEGTLRGLGDGSGRLPPWQCRAAEKSKKMTPGKAGKMTPGKAGWSQPRLEYFLYDFILA